MSSLILSTKLPIKKSISISVFSKGRCSYHLKKMSRAGAGAAVITSSTQKTDAETDITRPRANFRPCVWGDVFLHYGDNDDSMEVNDSVVERQIEAYKEEVKKMFLSYSTNNDNVSQMLNFIDSIQRLGLSYHFEHEISQALDHIHSAFINNNLNLTTDEDAGALHSLALLFRLLRKQGYRISSDIFKKFKNSTGKFDGKIAQDVQGMWSLYEAAQLRIHGEDILDEALDFTATNLKSMVNHLSPSLATQINHSLLRHPLHKEVPGLQAKRYMSFYEEDPSNNKVLLTLAKFNFNMLQRLHQKEVGHNFKWWKKLNFVTKVPYARDRVVESYFWSFHMSYEPQYSTSRRIVGKLAALLTALDDTYDAFATFEELEILTEAIKRWDISLIESLPECIKVLFAAIEELWNEIKLIVSESGKSDIILDRIKQDFSKSAQAYMVEAKWLHENYVPTYDEYKVNAAISISVSVMVRAFIGLGDFATKEVVDWIITDPKIVGHVALMGRLIDDLSTHEFEQQRNHVASAVECCMKQYGITKEEAYQIIQKETEDLWKNINEECLKLDDVPNPKELEYIINLARICELMYANYEDRCTNGELLKSYVTALLLDPIVM